MFVDAPHRIEQANRFGLPLAVTRDHDGQGSHCSSAGVTGHDVMTDQRLRLGHQWKASLHVRIRRTLNLQRHQRQSVSCMGRFPRRASSLLLADSNPLLRHTPTLLWVA